MSSFPAVDPDAAKGLHPNLDWVYCHWELQNLEMSEARHNHHEALESYTHTLPRLTMDDPPLWSIS